MAVGVEAMCCSSTSDMQHAFIVPLLWRASHQNFMLQMTCVNLQSLERDVVKVSSLGKARPWWMTSLKSLSVLFCFSFVVV